MNIINNENRADAGAGVHAVIQHTGEVYVGLPINPEKKTAVRNWHGGSGPKGSCNNTHIGVEMTEPATIKYTGGASWIELSDGSNTKAVVLKITETPWNTSRICVRSSGGTRRKTALFFPIRKDTPAGTPQTTQTLSIFGKVRPDNGSVQKGRKSSHGRR